MAEISDIILKKRALLKLAEAEVKTLQAQISALEDAASDDTDFARYLEEKKAKSKPYASPVDVHPKPSVRDYFAKPKEIATPSGRNPKGLIRRELLNAMADEVERDLDQIEDALRPVTAKPIGRPALRAFLMKLRKEGIVTSRKAGLFQLVQKGESPAGAGLSV